MANWFEPSRYLVDDCISVAVNANLDYRQNIAALLAFLPPTLSAAGEEDSIAGGERFFKTRFVGVGEHKNSSCIYVLNHNGNQPVAVELRY